MPRHLGRGERGYLLSGSDGQSGELDGQERRIGRGLAAAGGGVELGVGARFARFGTGVGTSNVASDPLRDRTLGDAVDASHESGAPRAAMYPSMRSRNGMRATL